MSTPTSLAAVDTPALMIDADRLERNLDNVADACRTHGKSLRPHVKTHKMIEIAALQRDRGAIGLTVAKLGEAEVFADAGFDDLFVCYPIVGELKLQRLVALARRVRVSTIVDDPGSSALLSAAAVDGGVTVDVLLKLDVGMHRVGVGESDAMRIAHRVATLDGLHLRGVCIHEGNVYGERDPERRRAVARDQVSRLVAVAERLRRAGLRIDVVSSGATPALEHVLDLDGVTEVRPGNYVFYDTMQAELGVVAEDRCALTVLTTVVSRADPQRGIVDAGAKALTVDRGAHGSEIVSGYGRIRGRDDVAIVGLSEEHGWLRIDPESDLRIGDRLEIIPNHACPVVNNFDAAAVVRGGFAIDKWSVAARGRMT